MKKRYLLFVMSIAIIVGLIYFSGIDNVVKTLSNVNPLFILLYFFVSFFIILIRTFRWNILLKRTSIDIPFFKLMQIYCYGMLISNFTPGKIGEPVKAFMLKKINKDNISNSLPSILLERIFDVLIMLSLASIGILFILNIENIMNYMMIAILFYSFIMLSIIFIVISEKRTKYILNIFFFLFSFIPSINNKKEKLENFSVELTKTIKLYINIKTIVFMFFITILIWIIESINYFMVFSSLGFNIDLIYLTFVFPLIISLSTLTMLPGGLGSTEVLSSITYSNLFGLTLANVAAVSLLGRLLFYLIYGSIALSLHFKKNN